MDQMRDGIEKHVETRNFPSSRGLIGWFALLAVLVVAAGWFHHSTNPAPVPAPKIQPMPVAVAIVDTGKINVTLNALGTVTSLSTVTVKPQVSGQLVKINFEEGQDVSKGDILAEIDPRPYEAILAQAKGQLARDQALLQGAEVDLKRYQNLVAHDAVQHQTLDTQVALVAQYQGLIEVDKAAIQSATISLDFCSIVAPVNGRVGLRQVDQGNYVTPTDASGIVVITQIQPISVLFTVPEDELQAITKRLHEGATLPVMAFDRTGTIKLTDGQLQTFDSQIDPTTGTIKLRASFPNENHALYPNQFVNIELIVNERKGVVIAPIAAIQRGLPGTFVYIVNHDDTVSVRQVKLGVTEGERVEILSGLQPGDRVVVDGLDRLREGAKVAVRQNAEPPVAQPHEQQQQPGPGPAVTDPPTSSTTSATHDGGKAMGGKHKHPPSGQ